MTDDEKEELIEAITLSSTTIQTHGLQTLERILKLGKKGIRSDALVGAVLHIQKALTNLEQAIRDLN